MLKGHVSKHEWLPERALLIFEYVNDEGEVMYFTPKCYLYASDHTKNKHRGISALASELKSRGIPKIVVTPELERLYQQFVVSFEDKTMYFPLRLQFCAIYDCEDILEIFDTSRHHFRKRYGGVIDEIRKFVNMKKKSSCPELWDPLVATYGNAMRLTEMNKFVTFPLPLVSKKVELFRLPDDYKGVATRELLGVRATETVRKGETLMYFAADIQPRNLCVGRNNFCVLDEGKTKLQYNAISFGNESRYINAYNGVAEEPNVKYGIELFHAEHAPSFVTSRPIVAIKDIEKGEELLLDYGPTFWEFYENTKKNDYEEEEQENRKVQAINAIPLVSTTSSSSQQLIIQNPDTCKHCARRISLLTGVLVEFNNGVSSVYCECELPDMLGVFLPGFESGEWVQVSDQQNPGTIISRGFLLGITFSNGSLKLALDQSRTFEFFNCTVSHARYKTHEKTPESFAPGQEVYALVKGNSMSGNYAKAFVIPSSSSSKDTITVLFPFHLGEDGRAICKDIRNTDVLSLK